MKPIDLNAIRARVDAATPGPWVDDGDERLPRPIGPFVRDEDDDARGRYDGIVSLSVALEASKLTDAEHDRRYELEQSAEVLRGWDDGSVMGEVDFVVHAREDLPALLDLVDLQMRALLRIEADRREDGALACCGYSEEHAEDCALDAALTAAGLPTQSERDAARAEIARGR